MKARHHRKKPSRKGRKLRGIGLRQEELSIHLKEDAASKSTPRPVPETPPSDTAPRYVCSRCGYGTGWEDPNWLDSSIPIWDGKGKKPEDCWSLCPEDDGPEVNVLTSPDRRAQRYRYGFQVKGKILHACTPFVVMDRKPDGRCSVGPVMGAAEVIREVMLMQYLESHPPDQEIDLRHLRETELFSPHFHCYQVKNRWLLALRRYRLYDDWARKALKIVHEERRAHAGLVRKLASALDPRQETQPLSRILHVAVDMSLPIGEQLERIKPKLTEIRDYLYRFTTQPPPRDRTEFIWRDVYIFLLARFAGKTVAQIAEKVFPDEHKKARYDKVDLIIRKVQKAADRAGVTIPSSDTEIKYPT